MGICPPDVSKIMPLIEMARREDLGTGDITTEAMIDESQQGVGRLVAREPGTICGMILIEPISRVYHADLSAENLVPDGAAVREGDVLGLLRGPLRTLLTLERVLLNFLQRLSGIATQTRRFSDAVAGTNCRILDTRKTTPGWRELEKYAVRAGGGFNHRMGLYDAVLIKDNHLAAARGEPLGQKIAQMRESLPVGTTIELEVDTFEQYESALNMGVDIILLDNMDVPTLLRAAALRNRCRPDGRPLLEASGSVKLSTVRQLADTGVDRISIGALTHSAIALDLSLDMEEQKNSNS